MSGVKTGGVGVDEFVELSSRDIVGASVGMEGTTRKKSVENDRIISIILRIKQYWNSEISMISSLKPLLIYWSQM